MYQKIDDIQETTAEPQPTSSARGWLTFFVFIGFSAILASAIWAYNHKAEPLKHSADQAELTDLFQRIQAEPRKSIRRARLIDYTQNYPDSPVINGAKQQLRVMNEYEARDWAALSDIMFEDPLTPTDKAFALERYIDLWGEGLAGSRDDDLAAFRANLTELTETTVIDRAHTPDESPIPTDIDGSQMVGGHQARPVRPRYPEPLPTPVEPQTQEIEIEITPLRVRRNRSPDYPRRAYARGVPATVVMSLNIDDRGRVRLVETISVTATRYQRDFERAARNAARGTRYYPRKENGRPVPVAGVRRTYVFDPEN